LGEMAVDLGKTYVRILGTRLDRFVEFEFSINDATLAIELVMPFGAFAEFCKANECTVLAADQEAQAAFDRLSWRERQPGLYRPPEDQRDKGRSR
jgi:phenol/toluene 2-monooxygenase (NADH) P0/A0